MKLTDIKKDLKNRLSERRYVHSAGVAASAYILAEKYGYNPKKAELAGWLHDCAKEMKLEEMQDIIDESDPARDLPQPGGCKVHRSRQECGEHPHCGRHPF